MRVFMTGGTGFIGGAVVRELVSAGHQVTALIRSSEKASIARRLGAESVEGDLADPSSYEEEASGHDALVHCAFDYAAGEDAVETDAMAIATFVKAGKTGVARRLVYTSGCWVLGNTGDEPAAEDAAADDPPELVAWRTGHEKRVLDATGSRLSAAVVRPGLVYGGSGSLTAMLFTSAEEEGASAYIGEGQNHWSMVHRRDLARLYRLIVEEADSGLFHGVDGHPVRVVDAAAAASEAAGAGGVTRSVALEDAREELGPVADALCMDQQLIAVHAAGLGWKPELTSFPDHADEAYRELLSSRH
jgi:nucleoside-diphosphate-sugar epimerase